MEEAVPEAHTLFMLRDLNPIRTNHQDHTQCSLTVQVHKQGLLLLTDGPHILSFPASYYDGGRSLVN